MSFPWQGTKAILIGDQSIYSMRCYVEKHARQSTLIFRPIGAFSGIFHLGGGNKVFANKRKSKDPEAQIAIHM